MVMYANYEILISCCIELSRNLHYNYDSSIVLIRDMCVNEINVNVILGVKSEQ